MTSQSSQKLTKKAALPGLPMVRENHRKTKFSLDQGIGHLTDVREFCNDNYQGGHGTGKTGNLVLTFSDRENTGNFAVTQENKTSV